MNEHNCIGVSFSLPTKLSVVHVIFGLFDAKWIGALHEKR